MKKQLFVVGLLNGQKQPSTPVGLQAETITKVPSSFVQSVQWEVMSALAGITSSPALKSIAAKLPSKSIFFFTSKFSLSARSRGLD